MIITMGKIFYSGIIKKLKNRTFNCEPCKLRLGIVEEILGHAFIVALVPLFREPEDQGVIFVNSEILADISQLSVSS